jgi:D-glycero-alpha-D-manno-heptose-7-phosphate kinase
MTNTVKRCVRARAPLRLGFGGGGTDVSPYCDQHGGAVVNATIDLFAHVTIRGYENGRLRLTAADRDATWEGGSDEPAPGPLFLLKAVYERMVRDFNAGRRFGLDITSYADCPPGSGLGSSSALVVAIVQAMNRFMDLDLDAHTVAKLAFDVERVDLGLAGGRQDQYAAAFGGLNFMRFHPSGAVQVEPIAAPIPFVRELEASLLLYFTGVSRDSAAIIEEQSRNMHARTPGSIAGLDALKTGAYDMRDAIRAGDFHRLGTLLDSGWASKKLTAGGISSAGIDAVYQAAKAFGVFGGKVSGAGGGGFMMFLVDPPRREDLRRLLSRYGGSTAFAKFFADGAHSWDSPPVAA